MNLYVGTSGYSCKEWKGTFYPQKLPAKQMLPFYSEHFRTVEINYTFRRLPTASVLDAWADAVPADFQFALKAPELITHRKRFKDAGDSLSGFSRNRRQVQGAFGAAAVSVAADFQEKHAAAACVSCCAATRTSCGF